MFSSAASRNALVTACAESPVVICCAHQVLPADGDNLPLCRSPCHASEASASLLLGGDTLVINGMPRKVPAVGGSILLCDVHDRDYCARSSAFRCSMSDCCRRGFSVQLADKTCVTCAVHLQDQIDRVAGSVFDVGQNPPSPSPKKVLKKKVTVSVDVPEATAPEHPFPNDATHALNAVDGPSESSTSESWTDRENELRKLTSKRKGKARRSKAYDFDMDQDDSRPKGKKKQKSGSISPNSDSDAIIGSRLDTFRNSLSLRRGRKPSSDSGKASPSDIRSRHSNSQHSRRRTRDSDLSDHSPDPSSRSQMSQVRLPSFLKQPLPRGTGAPVILRDDPRLRKRRKSGWESVSDALNARGNARDGIKEGESDTTYPRLLERTLFALRGFGCFDVTWGIGSYGENFTELIRRIGSDNTEDLRIRQAKCKITNRIAVGMSTLKMGSKKLGFEDEKNLLLGDFHQVSNAEIEDHFLNDVKAEKRPAQPTSVEAFRRCAENQTSLWRLLFGEQYRAGRELCLSNLLELREDAPELFSLEFLIVTWEAFIYDYLGRSFEGMRRLGQFRRSSDDITEIRRLALARRPEGGVIWKPPLSLNMISSRGYWRRNVLPRLAAGVEKVGYSIALEKIVGSAAASGKRKKKPNWQVGSEVKRLYPIGKRLPAHGRNLMMQHVPKRANSGIAICLDYNAHAGCQRGIECQFARDFLDGKNMHWCVE